MLHSHLAILNDEDYVFKCDNDYSLNDPIDVSELKNRSDASKWYEAMNNEINSLNENNTWTLCELPSGGKTISTKWVFKTKRKEGGEIIRYKARLVAKDYTQRYGVDYTDTFAPVVRYSTIRLLMAIAVRNNLKIHQMDAITAFLQGDIDAEIYLEQPCTRKDGTQRVCKLNRAIYGLKQAGKQWNKKLDATLKSFGLNSSKMDPCVYFLSKFDFIIAIYIYLRIRRRFFNFSTEIQTNCSP